MQLMHKYLSFLYHLLHLLSRHWPILYVIIHLPSKADYGFQAKLCGVISGELHEFLHSLIICHILHWLKREARECCQTLVIIVITDMVCRLKRLTPWLLVRSSLILFESFPNWLDPSGGSPSQRTGLLLLLH
jgi:hypothetical protein